MEETNYFHEVWKSLVLNIVFSYQEHLCVSFARGHKMGSLSKNV